MPKRQQPKVGDKVRLTGKFLRNTGQVAGGEGQSRWKVVDHGYCSLCMRDFVAVDERSYDNPSFPRHFAVANLEVCR